MTEPSPYAADLQLAAASATGDPRAIAALDALMAEVVRRAVRRIDPSPDFADVVTQELRSKMLVGERPRILEYRGRSSLRRWLTTAAVRAGLNLRRTAADRPHDSVGSGLRALGGDPELALLRARGQAEVGAAVQAALGRIAPRDRAILRLSVIEGLGVAEVAALYRVGKSTAARWVVNARDALRALVRAELRVRLLVSDTELESFAHALASDIDVSLARMLADDGNAEAAPASPPPRKNAR